MITEILKKALQFVEDPLSCDPLQTVQLSTQNTIEDAVKYACQLYGVINMETDVQIEVARAAKDLGFDATLIKKYGKRVDMMRILVRALNNNGVYL